MNMHPADALIAEGLQHHAAGRAEESIGSFTRAVESHPSIAGYRLLIGALNHAGHLAQAHTICKQALRFAPQEPDFHLLWADLKKKLGQPGAAREVLHGAVQTFPNHVGLLVEYSRTLVHAGSFNDALRLLERVVALKPRPETYRALAKTRRLAGDTEGAQRATLEARECFPLDTTLANDCTSFAPEAAAKSLDAMRAALPTMDPPAKSNTLQFLTRMQTQERRLAVGAPLEAARDFSDLVKWSDPEGLSAYIAGLDAELAAPSPRIEAVIERAYGALGQLDWRGAEKWFARARETKTFTVADVTTFDPAFYRILDSMTDADFTAVFPPVSEIVVRKIWPKTMIYVSCDPKYFDLFFHRFAASLRAVGATAGIHAHVLDGSEEEWRRLAAGLKDDDRISFSMTAESGARSRFGENARNYYHAARYVRFYQYLAQHKRTAWIMDVDTVVEGDPAPLFKLLDGYDVALTTTPVSLEPWAKIRAGIVGINPAAAGLRYMRLVAGYITYWYNASRLRWGIDQQALFGAYFYADHVGATPKTRYLSEEAMNVRDELALIFRPVTDATRLTKNL